MPRENKYGSLLTICSPGRVYTAQQKQVTLKENNHYRQKHGLPRLMVPTLEQLEKEGWPPSEF